MHELGLTVSERKHADGSGRAVALTGYALPDDVQRAAEAGFEHHLTKPLNMEDLEALLAGLPEAPTGACMC